MAKNIYTVLIGSFTEVVGKKKVARLPGDQITMDETEAKAHVEAKTLVEGDAAPKSKTKAITSAALAKETQRANGAEKARDNAQEAHDAELVKRDEAAAAQDATIALRDALIEKVRAAAPDIVVAAEQEIATELAKAGGE